jgi:hypothetical protein
MAKFAELQGATPGRTLSYSRESDLRGLVDQDELEEDDDLDAELEQTEEALRTARTPVEKEALEDAIYSLKVQIGNKKDEPVAAAKKVSFSELAGGKPTAKTPAAPKSRSELDIQVGGVAAGARAVTNEAATLADMLLNTPTSIVGIGANITRRLGGIIKGEDRKATAKAGRELQERIEATAPNLVKKFVGLFPTPPGSPEEQASNIEKAMGAVMEWSDQDAKNAEERSGGAIKAEDVQLWRDTALSMLGMKGITVPTKALVKRAGEKTLAEARPPVELEVAPPPTPEVPAPTAKFADLAATVEQTTGVTDVAARTTPKAHKAREAEIKEAFESDPAYADYFRNLVEEELRLKQAEATRPQRLKEAEGVVPRTESTDPVILTPEGKVDTTVVGQRSLDTGLAKIAEGRSFDLTATEKVAIRDNARQWGNRIQQGKIDPELLKLMGASGAGAIIGAYLLGDEDITGAALGAVGGLAGRYAASRSLHVQRLAESIGTSADYAGGLVSTRVKNISEPLHHRLIEHEREVFRNAHRDLTVVAPFIEKLDQVKGPARKTLDAAILTNDPIAIRNAMRLTRIPGLLTSWTDVRKLLDERGKDTVDLGLLTNLRDDYFPRVVKDVPGLLNHLGLAERTALEKKLAAAESRALATTGQSLSPEARSEIINKELAHGRVDQPGSSFRKERAIGTITEDMLPFYESPIDSITRYVRSTAQEHAKAKFFGRKAKGAQTLDESIGAMVDEELANKNVSFKDAEELKSILRSRFVGGERTPSAGIQDLKNLGYTSLLGHPTSALVQLSDVAATTFTQGLLPTIEAVVTQIRGKGVKAKDFGLLDHVAEELASTRGTAKLLNLTLKAVGFSAIDRFGKNNALTAAKIRHQRLARTPKGQADIVRRYGEAFGPDTPQLISDLAMKRDTDLVNSLLFHELSRQQPISKIEVPQAYLDNPNARVVYMLKTFMLKQMDLARREAYNEIKQGHVVKGAKALIGLGLIWGTTGAVNSWVRDWIMGKEVEPKGEDVWENIFKTFGWSSYVLDKAEKGQPVQAAIGTIAPPVSVADDILGTTQKLLSDKEMKPRDYKGVQHVPIVGRLAYNRGLGGAEDSNRRKQKREKAAERKRLKELQEE